jgi:hypothetical protein
MCRADALIVEEAGCDRPLARPECRDIEQLAYVASSLIHSTMSPEARFTILHATPGIGVALLELRIEREPAECAIARQRQPNDGMAVVEGEPAQETGQNARGSNVPLAGSIVPRWPVPEFSTHSRPSTQRGECGIDSLSVMIALLATSITQPPFGATVAPSACNIASARGRHIGRRAIPHGKSVEMTAVFGRKLGNEGRLPEHAKGVRRLNVARQRREC